MPKAFTARAIARQNDVIVNRARVQAASDAAAVEDAVNTQIAAAVVSDLATDNPYLAAKFTALDSQLETVDQRLDDLETP